MQVPSGFPTFPYSERDHPARGRFGQDLTSNRLSVRSEASIHADIRRLFHALTDPEYLEAWLCVPGHCPGCSVSATRYDRDYHIEHSCEGRQSVVISGRYLVLRRRHVMFSWKVSGNVCVPGSEVEIRLYGDFERTTLSLQHSGFRSRHDSIWHQALWNVSIGRLVSLYGSLDSPQFCSERDRDQPGNVSGFGGARRRTNCA